MGEITTRPRRGPRTHRRRPTVAAACLLAALAAAACGGREAAPGELLRDLGSIAEARAADDRTMPVVAIYPSAAPAPAPLAEATLREARPPQRPLTIAIGKKAAAAFDEDVEGRFEELAGDLAANRLSCSDREAVEMLLVARADFAVIGGQLSSREMHAGLRETRLAVELFALAVADGFPAASLTRAQVRQVFSGEVADWRQLGLDAGPIVVVVPADPALADRAAHAVIPGDAFPTAAVRAPSERHVADQILRNKGAIGIVRLHGGKLDSGQKLLQIDWTAPSIETFGYGLYPFGIPIHLVTSGQPGGAALRFLEFTRSPDGRELLARKLAVR